MLKPIAFRLRMPISPRRLRKNFSNFLRESDSDPEVHNFSEKRLWRFWRRFKGFASRLELKGQLVRSDMLT